MIVTSTHVLLTRQEADETMALLRRHTRLSRELRGQVEQEHQMLIVALTQLAGERGVEREHFIRSWLRDYRGQPKPRSIEKAKAKARARRTARA